VLINQVNKSWDRNKENMDALKMATGMVPADTSFLRPHPPPKSLARARALHPPRAENHARARNPRAFRARGHTGVPARLSMYTNNQVHMRYFFFEVNPQEIKDTNSQQWFTLHIDKII
jgi:hypothetical protein